jgi:hypothetical protein
MSDDQPSSLGQSSQAPVSASGPEHQPEPAKEEQAATTERANEPQPGLPEAAAKGSARTRRTEGRPREEEQDDLSVLDQATYERQERRQREENLKGYGADGNFRVGRDWIGQSSSRVYGGGNLNQAGGDININYAVGADAGIKIRYMLRRDAERLEACLAPSDATNEVSTLLAREPVVFLRGAIGTGRRTTAIAALLAWARTSGKVTETEEKEGGDKEERVGVIYGPGSPLQVSVSELRSGYGYVLDGTNRQWINDLDEHGGHLRDLADKSECRLVVLLPIGCSYPPRPTVVHRPPSANEVFRRWLEYEGLAAGLEPSLPTEVAAAIDADLQGEDSPRKAVDLADHVIDLLRAETPPAHVLVALPARAREHIRVRLDESRPIVGRCFMVSAAVLDDLPEVVVSDAALTLAEHIDEAWPIKEEERPLPAWEQLRTWLDYADASTNPAGRPGGGRSVRLNRAAARRATLQVLWEDHPTIREPLVIWLRGLAEQIDRNVQLKAAHAAGMLATFDFDSMMARVLTPWSKSRRRRDHQLAAMMLEAAARDRDLLPRVQERLRQLASGAREERLVATYAYGSNIGVDDPIGALRVLRRITLDRNQEVNKAVAGTVDYLYSFATSAMMLGELADWVTSGSPSGRYTAALAFVRLASIDNRDADRPPLCSLPTDSNFFGRLVVLWRNALSLRLVTHGTQSSQLLVPDSWSVLARWVSQYDEESVVRRVIYDVFGEDRLEAGRLRKAFLLHLLHWRRRNVISADLYQRLVRLTKGN